MSVVSAELFLAILVDSFVATIIYVLFYKMETKQSTNEKSRKNPRKQINNAISNDNTNTVIDRKKINANWELFLQNQPVNLEKSKDIVSSTANNNNSYWKAKRLEKKHNLKNGLLVNQNVDNKNTTEGTNQKPSKNADNVNSDTSKMPVPNRVGTITKCVAMDCEMVGIGPYGRESILARVSLVNKFGDCIYDKFVKPREKVTDYRTPVSGVRKDDLMKGELFEIVQKEVAEIIKGRILVGHAIKKDLEVLFLSHPKKYIRDTSKYKPFRKLAMGSTPSLKNLSRELLGVKIQGGEHSSVEDARATIQLYSAHQRQWESAVRRRKGD